MLRILSAVGLLLTASCSFAACDELVEKINRQLHMPQADTATASFEWSSCKAMPWLPGKTIVAFARYKRPLFAGEKMDTGDGYYDLDVVVFDEKKDRIAHRLVLKDALSSDAERLEGLGVDTARYNLARNVRAFGIGVRNTHLGGTNSERYTLYLFALRDGKLVELTGPLGLGFSASTRSNTECVEYRERQRSIVIAKTSSHGYADLVVNEKSIEPEMTMTPDGCKEVGKLARQRYVLKFDGSRYMVPEGLRY